MTDTLSASAATTAAAIVLAAGESRRMGPDTNKLLMPCAGGAMVRQVVSRVLASSADPVLVVVGHEALKVKDALAGLPVQLVENPAYAAGISGSLRTGLSALPESARCVLVCLGDMPWIEPQDMDRLIAAYSEAEGRLIGIPTYKGRRGNPVLWGRRFFAQISQLSGDQGARNLLRLHPEWVYQVEMGHDGIHRDVDFPEDMIE